MELKLPAVVGMEQLPVLADNRDPKECVGGENCTCQVFSGSGDYENVTVLYLASPGLQKL